MLAALQIVAMFAVYAGAPLALVSPSHSLWPALESTGTTQIAPNPFTELKAGSRLEAGGSLFSPLCGFRLTMQTDGNLVLYCIDDMKLPQDVLRVMSGGPDVLKLYAKPIWSAGTHFARDVKARGKYCIMEEQGNFVVYDHEARPIFETRTDGQPGSFLRLQSDGNLVVYTTDMKPLWSANTAARPVPAGEIKLPQPEAPPTFRRIREIPAQLSMDLRPGGRLKPGDGLYSPLAGFKLTLEGDGNLVLYVLDDVLIPGDVTPVLLHTQGHPDLYHISLWSTGTNAPRPGAGTGAYCVMNDDGNFVVYDEDNRPCFQTGTKGNPGAFLRCQDDGNLVVYTRDNKAIWQSKTYARFVDDPTPSRP